MSVKHILERMGRQHLHDRGGEIVTRLPRISPCSLFLAQNTPHSSPQGKGLARPFLKLLGSLPNFIQLHPQLTQTQCEQCALQFSPNTIELVADVLVKDQSHSQTLTVVGRSCNSFTMNQHTNGESRHPLEFDSSGIKYKRCAFKACQQFALQSDGTRKILSHSS